MQYYFKLQLRRINRVIEELGVHPYLAYLLLPLLFVILSKGLFVKTEFANWIYLVLATSAVLKMGDHNRCNSLRSIFKMKQYYYLRVIENLIVSLPFVLYLLYELAYIQSLILIAIAVILCFVRSSVAFNESIPTPFKRIPFEFIIGFRKTFVGILLCFLLMLKAVQVDNFYLGLFAMVISGLVSVSYYFNPESNFFVWIYSGTADKFLKSKVKMGLIGVSIINTLFVIILCIKFYSNVWIVLIVQFVISLILTMTIFAKYSAYPKQINLPQTVLFALCVWFPPMLLIVTPLFYKQATRNLKDILE